jgi:hypothetical protein
MNLKEFVNPPKRCRPSPFWSWNDVIEASEVETKIREIKRKGFGGFFIHSRTGLRTEYLGEQWMQAVRRGVEIARELEMECWLYDEDRWPSGFAGGKTTENNDENLAMALSWVENASSLDKDTLENAIAFTKKDSGGAVQLLSEKPKNLTETGVFVEKRFARGHFWFNGENYSDLLNPETVKAFIENTYECYTKQFGHDFGEFMPGIFTDEPNVNRNIKWFDADEKTKYSFPWSPGFVDFFEELHGYSPLDCLHHLLNNTDEGITFRHDFWLAVNERFLQSYTIPLSTWCREHDIKLTGHYLYEDDFFSMISSGGAVMPHYEYMDIPGIDHLGRNIDNPWTVKQVTSVANQLGKERTICEIFGAAGHSMSFEDMKWIADFNFALGISFICPHLVQYSMKGERKRDYPPTFSHHQPYWEHLRVINDYLARCSWAASIGNSVASVLVMAPECSAYGICDIGAENGGENLKSLEDSYHALIGELLAEHIAFDLGDERIVRRHGKAENAALAVGESKYSAVILPCSLTWRSSTLDLLESFAGMVVVIGDAPGKVDGKPDDRISEFLQRENVTVIPDNPAKAAELILQKTGRDVSITENDGSQSRQVLVNHRVEAAAHMLFLANTDREETKDVTVTVNAHGGVVELDPLSGRAFRYACEIDEGKTIIKTTLYPSGSRIFLLDQSQTSIISEPYSFTEKPLAIEGPYVFERMHDNVLTLDRCSLEIDRKNVLKDAPVWKVRKTLWQKTGIEEFLGCQPWVIEKKNVRTRANETALTFTFQVKDIPETISLAMESADRFTVKINGTKVEPEYGKWHIDKSFNVMNLDGHIKEGVNTITAETDFLWDTEIENIYLFGDFAVGSEEEGFPVTKEPETLDTGSWISQGYPFYSGSMVYKIEFDLPEPELKESETYEIEISGASGSTFFVTVNETEVGSAPFQPFRADITGTLVKGTNTIEAEVISTLRNTLGPLHHKDGDNLNRTGPEQFCDEANWTDSYQFVDYGFVNPPKLIMITRKDEIS